MEPEEVLSHFGVEEEKGLSWGQVKQARIEDRHDNRIPPPIDCPAWICCLLPCILRVPKMMYFNQIAAEDADVIREVGKLARARARALSLSLFRPPRFDSLASRRAPPLSNTRRRGDGSALTRTRSCAATSSRSA